MAYSSVTIQDTSVPHKSLWIDARDTSVDSITIAVPAATSGTAVIQGTSDTSVVLAERAADPRAMYSDDSAASVSDISSSFDLDGSLTLTGTVTRRGTYDGAVTFIRVVWTPVTGSSPVVISTNGEVQTYPASGSSTTRHREIDVRDYTASGVLTDDNIVECIELARQDAYAIARSQGGVNYGGVPDVYVPAGLYTITEGSLPSFPGVESYHYTPGLVGDGSHATVFAVTGLGVGEYALTTGGLADGTDDDTTASYSWEQNLRGFSIVHPNDNGIGCGIRLKLSYRSWLEDLRVQGFNATQHFDSGIGLRVTRDVGHTSNHQHLMISRCVFNKNQNGGRIYNLNQGAWNELAFNQSTWKNLVLEGVAGVTWNGATVQGGSLNDTDKWFGQADAYRYSVVTGWSKTSGLPSGTGATLGVSSGGLCLVSGMTGLGLDRLHEGRWLEITDQTPGSPDLVTGMYRIIACVDNSTTSCYIAKNSAHSSQTVDWQVREQDSQIAGVTITGSYDEADKRSTFFFGNDSGTEITIAGTFNNPVIDAVNASGKISVKNAFQSAGADPSRITRTAGFETDEVESRLVIDSYSRLRAQFRSSDGKRVVTGGGVPAARLRSAVELMGAIEAWDARLTSSLSISGGTAVDTWTGYINSTVLSPEFPARQPQYDAASVAFDGPAIATVAGDQTACGGFTGSIAGSVTTGLGYFQPTVFAVFRRSTTTNSVAPLRIGVTSGSSVTRILPRNASDTADRFTCQWFDGVANSTSGSSAFVADTNVHALIASSPGNASGFYTSQAFSDFEAPVSGNSSTYLYSTGTTGGVALAIDIAKYGSGGAQVQESLELAFVAVFARGLSEDEANQLIDMARNEWPLVY